MAKCEHVKVDVMKIPLVDIPVGGEFRYDRRTWFLRDRDNHNVPVPDNKLVIQSVKDGAIRVVDIDTQVDKERKRKP